MKYMHEDGTPFTKEEFLQKLKTDKEFNNEFGNKGIDQISELIRLLKETPDSRRMVVSAWAVHDLPKMVLPPCHYGFQVYTRELSLEERNKSMGEDYAYRGVFSGPIARQEELDKYKKLFDEQNRPTRAISLMWNQRSVDTFLGLPFNIASYGLLLEIIAKAVNMVPDELIGNLGDVHLYSNHVEQAKEQIGREFDELERMELGRKKGLWKEFQFGNIHLTCDEHNIPKQTREPYPLPTLKHMKTDAFYKSLSEDVSLVTHLDNTDFEMENYQSHPTIKAPLSN
jgi:thymidylate synthase